MLTPDMEKDWMVSRGIKDQGWTERELKWLEERSKPEYPAACVRNSLKVWDIEQSDCLFCGCHKGSVPKRCPLASDYKDAAEFSERVAALMAQPYFYTGCHQCEYSHKHKCSLQMHKGNIDSRWCLLKFRRFAVEEMMEAK